MASIIKPSPLNDTYFLVAAKLDKNDLWGIYLVDKFDNVTCLHKMEGEGYISPIAVRKTVTPPAIPDRVKLDDKQATVFIQDIYEGEGLKGIPRGTVKSLRLHAYEYAYVQTQSDHNWHGIQSVGILNVCWVPYRWRKTARLFLKFLPILRFLSNPWIRMEWLYNGCVAG